MGKRRSGDSVQKKQKQRYKREKRGKKSTGKPPGEPTKASEFQRILRNAKQDQRKQFVQLRPLSGGWIPKVTGKVLAELKKLESTSIGRYSYTVMRHRSDQSRVCFEVGCDLDLSSKKGKHKSRHRRNKHNHKVNHHHPRHNIAHKIPVTQGKHKWKHQEESC